MSKSAYELAIEGLQQADALVTAMRPGGFSLAIVSDNVPSLEHIDALIKQYTNRTIDLLCPSPSDTDGGDAEQAMPYARAAKAYQYARAWMIKSPRWTE